MTLIEFIKSNIGKGTPIGELAAKIQGDKDFPLKGMKRE